MSKSFISFIKHVKQEAEAPSNAASAAAEMEHNLTWCGPPFPSDCLAHRVES